MKEVYRILLVEDLPSDAKLAEREIKKVLEKYTIKIVETEDDFIRSLYEFDPHIVISDFKLPSFDGLSALKIVLAQKPLTPVVMLTGSMNEDTAVDCMKAGAADYVIKEHIKRLGQAVLNALEQREIRYQKNEVLELLRESEARFRNIFENSKLVMFLVDPLSGDLMDVNKAAERFYGWPRGEFLKMNIRDINTLGDGVFIEMDKALKDNQINFEFKHFRADGSVRDVEIFSSKIEISGKILLHSIVLDITEKKLADNKIRLLNRAIDQSNASIVITDSAGNFEYVNPAFTKLTGYSPDEVIGSNPRILKSGRQEDSFYKVLWNTILSGKNWQGEFQNRKKNGEIYWESAIISPLINGDGKISHFIAIKEDITDKKTLFENLITAKEKAEESDRLKTAFLHNISHEIRTPLNAIIGFSAFLDQAELSQQERRAYIDIIFQSNNQLLSIINDIINISHIEAGQVILKLTTVNVNKVVKNLHRQFLAEAQKKKIDFRIKTGIDDEPGVFETDESKLIQVISNLISNAIKFTEEGFIELGYEKKDDYLVFSFADSGIGIRQEEQSKIFNRFYQVDKQISRSYGGTGLGLSISKAYVEMLGGIIWVKSEPGEGSTFYFSLPYKSSSIDFIPEEFKNPEAEHKNRKVNTILVAEDEDSNFALLTAMLKNQGLNILRACNGKEAVELFRTSKDIGLILMDIKMPGMDGLEATFEILKLDPAVPIIAQTAYAHPADKEKALEAGCRDYLTKPFGKKELIGIIEKYL